MVYTEQQVIARVERLTVTRLRMLQEAECVAPRVGGSYSEAEVARLALACDLAEDFGLDEEALALVLSLIDQIHGLRRELRRLAGAVERQPPEVAAAIRAALRED